MWKSFGVAVLWAAIAAGETVHLSDGTSVQGKIYRNGSGWKLVLPGGSTRNLSANDVIAIDVSGNDDGGHLADQLASLRHSLSFSNDASQAMERLRNFIQHNPGTRAATDAEKDLAVWQDRASRHLVKIGNDWLTPAQAELVRTQTILIADHARELIRRGDVADAKKLIDQIVAVDPRGAAGLYLQGVLAYNANQLALAEKDFLAVDAILPQHGPTLNNLAVLSFHSQHYAQAAARYTLAMQSDPGDRTIIDNAAEVLHAFPPDVQNIPAVRQLQQEFVRQDAALQVVLAKQNLSRWGARWVTAQQLQQIQFAQKIIEEKLSQLAAQQTQLRTTINSLDQQIAANQQKQQQIANDSYVLNSATGQVAAMAYPQAYYDLEHDNVDLKARRQAAEGNLEDAAASIRDTRMHIPVRPYTGVQQIIGEEGTPVAPPQSAATQPATTKPATRP